jgi:hypothetical protein
LERKKISDKKQIQESNAIKLVDSMVGNTVGWVTTAAMISSMVAKECKKIFDKQQKGETTEAEILNIAEICGRVTKMAVDIQTRSMPEGQQDVLIRLVRDIEKMKEKTTGEIDEQI